MTVILQEIDCDSSFINKTSKRKEIVVGVSFPTQREDRCISTKNIIEEYAKSKVGTAKVDKFKR